jgi:hypothetical protein
MQDEKDDVQDKYGRFCERVGNPDSFDTDQGPQSQRVDRDHSEYFQEVTHMGVGQHFPDLVDAGKDVIPHVEGKADAGADQEIVCVIEDHTRKHMFSNKKTASGHDHIAYFSRLSGHLQEL